MKIAVIGAGIAGQMIIHRLMNQSWPSQLDWYSANSFAPACSLSSTSIVRRAGIATGVSELGDILYKSYDEFEKLFANNDEFKSCIEKANHYQQGNIDDEQFAKRYPNLEEQSLFRFEGFHVSTELAYLVYPNKLLQLIEKKFKGFDNAKRMSEVLVTDVNASEGEVEIVSINGKQTYDYVFVATGWNYQSIEIPKLEFRNFLSGHYIELDSDFLSQSYSSHSWSFSSDQKISFIHRHLDKKLLISASNTEDLNLLACPEKLNQLYDQAKTVFPDWDWPGLKNENLKVGVRLKGVQRKPYGKWIQPRLAVLNGLYKNGFSYAVKLSRDLVIELERKREKR